MRSDLIMLTGTQQGLFTTMVNTARRYDRPMGQRFRLVSIVPGRGSLSHPGLGGRTLEVVVSDLEALESASLVNLTGSASVLEVTLTENAAAYLNYLQEQAIDPLKRLVGEFWDYLDSEGFQSRHSQAWRKWQSAASLLWAAGDPSDFGNIGFRSRESMKAFVTDLVDMYDPPEVEPDPEKISDRLHDVLEFRQEQLGERSKPFLDALKDYWDKLARRYQLLVHHKTPEAQTLTLNDAKWIVYQTAMVMFEIDRSLSRGA